MRHWWMQKVAKIKGLGLGCLIDVMYDHTFLNLQIARSDVRLHIKWAVSVVIAHGRFSLPRVFVLVCIS